MSYKKKDAIFSNSLEKIVDFKFDDNVANVFPDMIKRSVPGYTYIITIIGMLTELYAQKASNYYDLGCSLGAAALSMRRKIKDTKSKVIAVDNSESMIEKCRLLMETDNCDVPVEVKLGDIREQEIENAAVVVLNFTLQFIKPENRDKIIQKIYDGLKPGGILILSEKLVFENEDLNERQIDLYHSFKRLNGYSDLEISQKRTALENVLIPESFEIHKKRIIDAGFSTCDMWFQCFNFSSILAVK